MHLIISIFWVLTGSLIGASFLVENPTDFSQVLEAPSLSYWFGTDDLGRSYFWIFFKALGLSFGLGGMSFFISLLVSVLFLLVLLKGRLWDLWFMRIAEAIDSLPSLLWAALIMGTLAVKVSDQSRFFLLGLILGVTYFPSILRLLRGFILKILNESFIEGANAIGVSRWRLLRYHLLPQVWVSLRPLIAQRWISLVLAESFLSFLGFGLRPPLMSVGALLHRGWQYFLSAPHLLIIPGAYLSLCFYLVRIKMRASLAGGPLKAQETDQ